MKGTTNMDRMLFPRMCIAAGVAMAALAASAYTANYWQAVDGDWNGKYSDVRHWSLGRLPSFDAGDDAVFINRTGAQYDVEIDVNIGEGDIPAPAFFKVSNANVPNVPHQPVRFYGNGKITQYHDSSGMYTYSNAHVIYDGNVRVDISGSFNSGDYTNRMIVFRGDAILTFGSNANLCEGDTFQITDRAKLTATSMLPSSNTTLMFDGDSSVELTGDIKGSSYINRHIEVRGNASLTVGGNIEQRNGDAFLLSEGCKVSVGKLLPDRNDVTFRMTGGELNLGSSSFAFSSASSVEFSGGHIVLPGGTLIDPKQLPTGAAVYDATQGTIRDVNFTTTFTNELSGTLLATNYTVAGATDKCGWIRLEKGTNVVYGGGSASAHILYIAGTFRNVLDLSRLNIGKRYYISGGEFIVPRDITVGAFGDYTWHSDPNYCARYLGTATFETIDCFDGVTVHNIGQGGLVAIPGSAFRITGGGNVDLGLRPNEPNEDLPGFRSIEVCDGSSAGITNVSYAGWIRVGQLSLGSGMLSYEIPRSPIEAGTVRAAANARLYVSLKSCTAVDTSSSGNLVRPVLVSGESECDIPVENVTLGGTLGTWRVKKVGGTYYLRDNTAKMAVTDAPYLWTGVVDGDWDKPDNWYGGAVPSSSSRVFFGVCDTTNVVTIPPGGVTVKTFSGAGHTDGGSWFRSSEPYIFRGGKITITQAGQDNYDSAFYDCGQMPKYFECDVDFTGNPASIAPMKSTSFLGGFTAKRYRARGGNTYFGGTATVESLELVAKYAGNQRLTSVTILPGGKFTATAENYTVPANAFAYLHILGGGEMTLNGTKFAYVGAPTLTNTVDGTLAINAPYTINTDQCFVGTGRVDIATTYSSGNVARQEICGGLRLNLGSGFRTVTSENAAGAIVVAVPDFRDATLGLKGNVTYGPADGVTPSTAAADRALSIGYKATLTIDTSDPDDGTPRTLTLKDPVIGGGDLTITGGGKVVLASAGNRVGKLTLSGGMLSVSGAANGWNDILTADSVVGLEGHVDGAIAYALEENGDGTVTLRIRRKLGSQFILR